MKEHTFRTRIRSTGGRLYVTVPGWVVKRARLREGQRVHYVLRTLVERKRQKGKQGQTR